MKTEQAATQGKPSASLTPYGGCVSATVTMGTPLIAAIDTIKRHTSFIRPSLFGILDITD
jgi:hypothetical protein